MIPLTGEPTIHQEETTKTNAGREKSASTADKSKRG
jgi:hypothetical protein